MRAVALLALLASAGCATWSRTRAEVVDPIHDLLHHRWPEALQEHDAAALAPLFATPEAAAGSLALLEGFGRVEHARVWIDRVRLDEPPVLARVELRLDGVDPAGALRSASRVHEFELSSAGGAWRIARDLPGPLLETPTPSAYFTEEAQLRGLWFRHEGQPTPDSRGEPRRYVFGSGVAAVDVDGNGYDDAILASGSRVDLFLNEGGSFERRSEAWGLGDALPGPEPGVWTVVLPRDFNGDGRRDLFLAAEFGQPRLLLQADGRFEPVPDPGIASHERTVGAVAADFDGDGSLDLYLANHESVFQQAPDLPYARNARPDQLFLGLGDGRFRDATREAGLRNTGWSLAPAAADYDGDGDVDVFVGNDFGDDALLRNDGRGRFREVAKRTGVDRPVAAMSADWGDYDGDGDFDLFVAGMASGSGWVLEVPDFRIRKVPRIVDALFRPYVRDAVRAWFRGNRIYENRGDGTFREVSADSGAERHGWGWGSVWLDFDNDGLLDLYASNGFISGPVEDDL